MNTKVILFIGGVIIFLLLTFIIIRRAMKNAEDVDPNDETFLK